MKKALLIVNPKAGKMKSKNAMYSIVSRLCENDYRVTVQTTLYRGHAEELAEHAWEDQDICICCGGDGTLNETVNGMMRAEKRLPIGYIPCGSTNDFAQSMKIPTTVSRAADAIVNGELHSMDIGRFNERYFTYIASFGAFTATSYNTPQQKKNVLGHFAYVLEGIKDLSSIQPYHMTVRSDESIYVDDYIFGAVSNSTSVGGIVRINKGIVDMCDGLFEVILVRLPKNAMELSRIVHGITVSDFSDDMFRFFKTSEITFETDNGIPWSLDGEYAEGAPEVTVTNMHNAIGIKK